MTFLNHSLVSGRDTFNIGILYSAVGAHLPPTLHVSLPPGQVGLSPSAGVGGVKSAGMPQCPTRHSKTMGQGGTLRGTKGKGFHQNLE